jgi:hypothetical protein
MADSLAADVGQVLTPDGRVAYDFQGHVKAQGLDLDAAPATAPESDRSVRWLDTGTGAMIAHVQGYETDVDGVTLAAHASSAARAAAGNLVADSAGQGAQLTAQAVHGDNADTGVYVIAAGQQRWLLTGDGGSDFVQPSEITDMVTIDAGPGHITGQWEIRINFFTNGAGDGAQFTVIDFPSGPPGTWFDWTIAAHIVDEDYGTHVSWGISQDGLADTQIRFQFAVDNIDPGVEVLGWFYLVFIGHP